MDCGAANLDVMLTGRIGNDANSVSHVRKSVGHFADACGGAMVSRERASRYHRD
jgi:hypothetical protein